MKKSISLLLVGLACIFAFILFSGVECNENEPSTCQVFQSEKITFRPTPIDEFDQPLNPSLHFQGLTGGSQYCLYWYSNNYVLNLCLKEAVVLTITIKIKEELKDRFYDVGGFINFEEEGVPTRVESVEDFTYKTEGGIYTATGNLTVSGDSKKGKGNFICTAVINMHIQSPSDIQITHNVLNNSAISISLDYGYTKWF